MKHGTFQRCHRSAAGKWHVDSFKATIFWFLITSDWNTKKNSLSGCADASLPPVLGDFVQLFDQGGHDGGGRHVDQVLHVPQRFLVVEIQTEFVLHFAHRLVRLQGNVRHAGVHHQRKQVQDQVGVSGCTKRTISMKIWREKCSDWNKWTLSLTKMCQGKVSDKIQGFSFEWASH